MNYVLAFLALISFTYVSGQGWSCTQTPFSDGCGFVGPSQDELFHIDRINTARSNPSAEGARLNAATSDATIAQYYNYYHVNKATLQAQFNSYPARPALMWNGRLQIAARNQAAYEAAAAVQTHNSADGSQFWQRIQGQGYSYSCAGENTYAYATSMWMGHVGFNVDWGVPDLDHRNNIMNPPGYQCIFNEIGVGVSYRSGVANFGPDIITQDFGTSGSTVTAIGGITYSDNNKNNAFDSGEGLPGTVVFFDDQNSPASYYVYGFSSGYYRADLPPSTYTIWWYYNNIWTGLGNVVLTSGSTIRKNCKIVGASGAPQVSNFNASEVNLATINPTGGLYNDTGSVDASGDDNTDYSFSSNSTNGNVTSFQDLSSAPVVAGDVNTASAQFVSAALVVIFVIVASLI